MGLDLYIHFCAPPTDLKQSDYYSRKDYNLLDYCFPEAKTTPAQWAEIPAWKVINRFSIIRNLCFHVDEIDGTDLSDVWAETYIPLLREVEQCKTVYVYASF